MPGTLVSHAADLAHFVATLPEAPVMVCHSLGGLILQKYLQTMESEGWLRPAGVAFLAAGPPSGDPLLDSAGISFRGFDRRGRPFPPVGSAFTSNHLHFLQSLSRSLNRLRSFA